MSEQLKNVQNTDAAVTELELEATIGNLGKMQAFAEQYLEEQDCPMKAQMQIGIAMEEVYVNVANYAYAPGTGSVKICLGMHRDPDAVTITFIDRGVPYDPLAKEDPDISLSAEERQIGGLGIYLVKKNMDRVEYEYRDQQNILKLTKFL